MNIKNVTKMCMVIANRTKFKAKKYSPEICLISAAITGIMCVVEACKSTHKSEPVFESHKEAMKNAEEYLEENPDNFNDDEKRRYIRHIYINTGIRLVKNYIKPAVLFIVTGGFVFGGYRILHGRNLALVSALAAEKAKNLKLLENREVKKLPESDNNTEQKEENKSDISKSLTPDEARFKFIWADGDKMWQDVKVYGPRVNPFNLEQTEEYFNRILPLRQVIFVNEIYDYFGKPRTYEGQYAGWIYDPKKGDHQIDFGLRSNYTPTIMFMNGEDPSGVCVCLNADDYVIDRALPRLNDMKDFYARGGRRK